MPPLRRTLLAFAVLLSVPALADDGPAFDFDFTRDTFFEFSWEPELLVVDTAQAANADSVVDGMQKFYENTRAFSAGFTQTYRDVSAFEQIKEGTVYFLKPGMMRWDYASPEEKYFISNGETFWAWEPAYRQYCEQKLQDSQLPTALTFLAGEGEIRDDFDVKLVESKGTTHRLELTPKVPASAYASIEFVVNAKTFRVEAVTIFDALGNENTLAFAEPEINADDIVPEKFAFTPPKDATQLCPDQSASADNP